MSRPVPAPDRPPLPDEARAAADRLAEARRAGVSCTDLPDRLLADPATADAIRRAAEDALGWTPVGSKIGATSAAIQTRLGTDRPFHSALFAERCYPDGAALPRPDGTLGIECEIALRVGVSTREVPASRAAAAALVDAVHPAIELVGQRLPGGVRPPVGRCIADFALSVAFAAGQGVALAELPDLAQLPVTALVDDTPAAHGTGAEVLGHPLEALIYLAAALAREGRGLRAGDWVSTGTCVGIVPAEPGQAVAGEFGPLGRLAITLA